MASKRKRKPRVNNAVLLAKQYSMSWEVVKASQIIELHQLLAEDPNDVSIADAVWLSQYQGALGLALRLGLIDKTQPYKVSIEVKAVDNDSNQEGYLFIDVDASFQSLPLVHFFNMERASTDASYVTQDGKAWLGFEHIISDYIDEIIPNSTVLSMDCKLTTDIYFTTLVAAVTFENQLIKVAKQIKDLKHD